VDLSRDACSCNDGRAIGAPFRRVELEQLDMGDTGKLICQVAHAASIVCSVLEGGAAALQVDPGNDADKPYIWDYE